MARVRQFANDLGISKNQAQNLINKGRSRKDGGSQILESVMKKPVYAKNGKYTKSKVKKEEVLMSSDMPKERPKNLKKIVKKRKIEQDLKEGNITIGDLNEGKGYRDGGFPDLTGDGNVTKADVLKGRGVPGFARGGGMAIQGLGFKGVR
jgi:hypothetical protein